jgi:thymidylate synthase
MKQYQNLVKRVRADGVRMPNRTGTDTVKVAGEMIKFHLKDGYPILTGKKTQYVQAIGETFGFFRAYTSAADFRAIGVKVWDKNANDPGKPGHRNQWLDNPFREGEDHLGGVYGRQWRDWPGYKLVPAFNQTLTDKLEADGWSFKGHVTEDGETKSLYFKAIDMLGNCVKTIINNPTDRRILFHAWNPAALDEMALPPCHLLYQFLPNTVSGELDLCVYIRSNDIGLGTPFNMIGAATICSVIARFTGYQPGSVTIFIADAHIYVDQFDYLDEMMTKEPLPLPTMRFSDRIPGDEVFSAANPNWVNDAIEWLKLIEPSDIIIENYQHHTLETPVPGMAV